MATDQRVTVRVGQGEGGGGDDWKKCHISGGLRWLVHGLNKNLESVLADQRRHRLERECRRHLRVTSVGTS